jgi:hypothetical protein
MSTDVAKDNGWGLGGTHRCPQELDAQFVVAEEVTSRGNAVRGFEKATTSQPARVVVLRVLRVLRVFHGNKALKISFLHVKLSPFMG